MGRWVPLFASMVAALGSLTAAFVAGRFAAKTRNAQSQAERVLELEKRLASSKFDVYQPMLELLREMIFDAAKTGKIIDEAKMVETMSKFGTWIQIFGSDEAVLVYHRWMQAAFHNPPPPVAVRLYAEFVLAARRDMGDPQTKVTMLDLLGIRLNDVYETFADDLGLDDKAFYIKHGWNPPWESTRIV